MYIADKTLVFTIKILAIIIAIIIVIAIIMTMIFSETSFLSLFEKALLGILEKFVDFVRSLFVESHDAARTLINNFELP